MMLTWVDDVNMSNEYCVATGYMWLHMSVPVAYVLLMMTLLCYNTC